MNVWDARGVLHERITFFLKNSEIRVSFDPGVPEDHNTPLTLAKVPKRILTMSPSLGTHDDGRTALHHAAIKGRDACVHSLIAAGANPNVVDKHGMMPLHYALWDDYRACAYALITAGANLNATNIVGMSPLHFATCDGHDACVQMLIAAGANPNVVDNDGMTPLHLAVCGGYDTCVRTLIAGGASLHIANACGVTPLHSAAQYGLDVCIRTLITAGASPHVVDGLGKTPLHVASWEGHDVCVRTLIASGANPNVANTGVNTGGMSHSNLNFPKNLTHRMKFFGKFKSISKDVRRFCRFITPDLEKRDTRRARQALPEIAARPALPEIAARPALPEIAARPAEVNKACAICLEAFASGHRLAATGCGHVFCAGCINASLNHNDECPTCRTRKPTVTVLYI
jgi:ankyrin repeat protein